MPVETGAWNNSILTASTNTWGNWNIPLTAQWAEGVWPVWVTGTSLTNGVWPQWVIETTGTTQQLAVDPIWPIWTNIVTTGSTNASVISTAAWGTWVEQYEISQEERDRRQAEAERYNRAALERQRAYQEQADQRRKEAEADRKRARRLLNSTLTVHQRKQMKEKQSFEVETSSGKRYRIQKGTHGNVKLLDNRGRAIESYCIQPLNASATPDEDSMLAQKLMLEADEERFLRIANARRLA